MNWLDNREYYAGRETAERDLAERADDPVAARIHRELADRYQEKIATLRVAMPQAR